MSINFCCLYCCNNKLKIPAAIEKTATTFGVKVKTEFTKIKISIDNSREPITYLENEIGKSAAT